MIRLTALIIITGAMSYANPGVLERVAANRAAGITAHSVPANWRSYLVLLAVQDCRYVGRIGVLVVEGERLRALVVDCQADADIAMASLSSLGLLADTNRADLVHKQARLVIKKTIWRRLPPE